MARLTLRVRILAAVEMAESGCWIWKRAIQTNGYGSINSGVRGRSMLAHRAAYIEWIGPIPDGMQLDHTCHTADTTCLGGRECKHRRCVNPGHLELVTQAENHERGLSPAAVNGRRTVCVNGHPLTPENTRVRRDGRRNCRTCQRAINADYRSRHREPART